MPLVVALWWALLDYASQHTDRGSIAGFDAETLAHLYQAPEDALIHIVDALRAKGLIDGDRIAKWDSRQPNREDDSAERTRQWRKRKADRELPAPPGPGHGDDVTPCDASVTHGDAARRAVTLDEMRGDEIRDASSPSARAREDAVRDFPVVAEAVPIGPDGDDPLARVLITVPSPRSYLAVMAEALAGAGGRKAIQPAELRAALTDYAANRPIPNLRLFRGYLRAASTAPPDESVRALDPIAQAERQLGRKLTIGERVYLRSSSSPVGRAVS